jgi:hypothetical protein
MAAIPAVDDPGAERRRGWVLSSSARIAIDPIPCRLPGSASHRAFAIDFGVMRGTPGPCWRSALLAADEANQRSFARLPAN